MTLVPPRDTKKLLEKYTHQYEAALPESPAETYLLRRGITKPAQSFFRLGFVAEPEPEQRAYKGSLAIPFITTNGDVVGVKYRWLDDRKPKYSSSLGFEARRIFNPIILTQRHRKIYITEGELDTVVLHLLGVPSIALPGATTWSTTTSRALRHRRVVVLADGDDAGEGHKLGKQIAKDVEDSSIILMTGSDVNQYYLDYGKDKLLEYIGWNG